MSAVILFSLITIIALVANAHETLHADPAKHVQNLISDLHEALYSSYSVDKSEHRKLQRESPTLVSINQYYTMKSYAAPGYDGTGSPSPTCDKTNGLLYMNSGAGLGCFSFAGIPPPYGVNASDMPGSMQLTCYNVNGANSPGVAFGATLYSSNTCSGTQMGVPNGAQAGFNYLMSQYSVPGCSTSSTTSGINTAVFANCAGNYVPASVGSGLRTAQFMQSPTCMGNPNAYSDVLNFQGSLVQFSCSNGDVKIAYNGQAPITAYQSTCTTYGTGSNAYYVSTGCVSDTNASPTAPRTFFTWNMIDVVNGISITDWNANPQYAVAFVSAAAAIYGIDYSSISAISATSGLLSTSVKVTYTIFVQPGFGNGYSSSSTASSVYNDIMSKHSTVIADGCQGILCLTNKLQNFASQKSLSLAISLAVSSNPPSSSSQASTTILSSPAAPIGQPPLLASMSANDASGNQRAQCGSGLYVKNKNSPNESCAQCPAGKFSSNHSMRNRRCKKCRVNTFSASAGASSCDTCPAGTSTSGKRGKKSCQN